MESEHIKTIYRNSAFTTLIGSICMLIGAALWGTSGTDLWAAIEFGNIEGYLTAVGDLKVQLIANLTFWIIGVLILGLGVLMISDLGDYETFYTQVAKFCFRTAIPMAIVSYIAMLVVVVQIAPDISPTSVAITEAIGWMGVRLDDIATALMLGVGPLFISLSGRAHWTPGWLVKWSYLATILGIISIVVQYFPGYGQYGFFIIPVGMGWMIATSIVLFRHAGKSPKDAKEL